MLFLTRWKHLYQKVKDARMYECVLNIVLESVYGSVYGSVCGSVYGRV
jgi:hypothetical protein